MEFGAGGSASAVKERRASHANVNDILERMPKACVFRLGGALSPGGKRIANGNALAIPLARLVRCGIGQRPGEPKARTQILLMLSVGDGDRSNLLRDSKLAPRLQSFDNIRRKDPDEFRGPSPLIWVREAFSEYVSCLAIGLFVEHDNISSSTDLMQPINGDSMCAKHVLHSRISTCLSNPNHRLIILVNKQDGLAS